MIVGGRPDDRAPAAPPDPATRHPHLSRRRALVRLGEGMIAALPLLHAPAVAAGSGVRFALTPVFLDNDADVTGRLQDALRGALGGPVEIVQRRTYQEVVGLLLDGSIDAAWLCGFPYLQHEDRLRLLAVPEWQGRPLYQSYLIAGANDPAANLGDLAGGVHAFSDPDSNSGWLVTASDLARMGTTPASHFARTIFTWGHRNVVRAVASGLAQSGSVDGYVWEALRLVDPSLVAATRIVSRSEWLGFPPVVGRAGVEPAADQIASALLDLAGSDEGRTALALLSLDRFAPAEPSLYEGIRARMRDVDPS